MFILRIAVAGDTVVPASGPGQAVGLTVNSVGLFTIHAFHERTGIGVLGIASVEVALAAIASFKLQRLHGSKFPAQLTVDIFVHHPFTPGRIRSGIAAGPLRLVAGVNILGISLGFTQIAP